MVEAKLCNRERIFIPRNIVLGLGRRYDDIISSLGDYVHVEAVKRNSKVIVRRIIPLKAESDIDTAREILDNHSFLSAVTVGLGYKDNVHIKRLLLTRVVSWFRGFDNRPIYTIQLTPPNTGKTQFAIRCMTMLNWEYLNEVPTLPRLIMDSRTGAYGIVFLRDGIVFDEFDKWSDFAERIKLLHSTLLTGMEQGVWSRGTTTVIMNAYMQCRFIHMFFTGNLTNLQFPLKYTLREELAISLASTIGLDIAPFVDRLSLVDIYTGQVDLQRHITWRQLPDNIMRGLIEVVQRQVKHCDVSSLQGRQMMQTNNVYSVLTAMGYDVNPETIDKAVIGEHNSDVYMKLLEEMGEC